MEFESRLEMPTVQEVFYGRNEPTYIMNTDPYGLNVRHPPMGMGMGMKPFVPYPREPLVPRYETRALVAPRAAEIRPTPSGVKVNHNPGLALSVPLCCEKCIEKVRLALLELQGVRDVQCFQEEQRVIVSGDVDPERALRRVRRVKKKSRYWREAIQPLAYSGSTGSHTKSRFTHNAGPSYNTSLYRAPSLSHARNISPPRRYTSSYSRAYSSPYIDSAYRSGHVEPRFSANYDRYGHDDLEHRPHYDRETPFTSIHNGF